MIGLGSSSSLGLGIIIQLRDEFTQGANKISSSLEQIHGNAQKAMRSSFNTMIGVGTAMSVAGYGITSAFRDATEEAVGFQKVLINIKALGEMSNDEMMSLGKIAQTMGPKYGKSAVDVAQGMQDLVKAGLNAKEIPQVMEAILQTAIAADEKLEGEQGVAARMVDIMMAWGMQANQAYRAGDILSKAAIESTVSFNDLAESMKYSQDILRSMGLTFEESVAMMGVLGNAGIKASMAGTSLGNAWREIAIGIGGGNKKKNSALHQLGIDPKSLMDSYGNMKRPLEILDRIKMGLRGMGNVQRQNVLTDLFGVRGKRGVNPLIDFLSRGPNDKFMGKSLGEMTKELQSGSVGQNLRIFEEKSKSIAFQTDRMVANWKNFKIAVGQAITPMLGMLLPIVNKVILALTSFASSGFGKIFFSSLALLGLVLIPLGAMVTTIGLVGRAMLFLNGGMAAFGTASMWIWKTLIARALTYAGIIGGIGAGQRLNSAGRLIDSLTGRFVTGGATGGLLGRILGPMVGAFSRLIPIVLAVGRALTVVGLVSLALQAIGIDIKTQLAFVWGTIKWVLGSIINAIMGILEWIPGVDFGGGGWSDRQSRINSGGEGGNMNIAAQTGPRQSSGYDDTYSRSSHFKHTPSTTIVNVHVDGEQIMTKKINNGTEVEMGSRYGLNQ